MPTSMGVGSVSGRSSPAAARSTARRAAVGDQLAGHAMDARSRPRMRLTPRLTTTRSAHGSQSATSSASASSPATMPTGTPRAPR